MNDLPPCLTARTEETKPSGYTQLRERCRCGQTIITTAYHQAEAERLAAERRKPHQGHRSPADLAPTHQVMATHD